MHRRTKALNITAKVKEEVYARDSGCCVLCGTGGLPEAHYISRAQGGLGIKQNIVTLCRCCHDYLDHSFHRSELLNRVKEYLEFWYPGFKDEDRIYKKRS